MMTVIKSHWTTALAILAAAFLLRLSIAALGADDQEHETADRFAVTTA